MTLQCFIGLGTMPIDDQQVQRPYTNRARCGEINFV